MKQTESRQKKIFFVLWFLIVGVRLFFVLYTPISMPGMQNDLGKLDNSRQGHLGYIYYLAKGGSLIYNGAASYYQFYHPPLHHLLCAGWLCLMLFLGFPLAVAGESLQLLTFIYSVITLVYLDKIVKKLHGTLSARNAVLCLAGFFPYAIFASGALNNDGLVTMLMIMTIYYLFVYYEKTSIKAILPSAICFGLAMLTKASALLLAPAITFLFLYQYIRNKKQRIHYIDDYMVFSGVSGVIGLWYACKNYAIYKISPLYVPKLSTQISQYLGDFPVLSRFLDWDPKQLDILGINFDGEKGQIDHNIFLSLLKYSLFAESSYYTKAEALSRILFFVFAILLFLLLLAALIFLIKGGVKKEYRITIGIVCLTNMVSYFRFCCSYPHVCTMHIRYVMTAVFLLCICAAFFLEGLKNPFAKCLGKVLLLVYGLSTVILLVVYQL